MVKLMLACALARAAAIVTDFAEWLSGCSEKLRKAAIMSAWVLILIVGGTT